MVPASTSVPAGLYLMHFSLQISQLQSVSVIPGATELTRESREKLKLSRSYLQNVCTFVLLSNMCLF